MILNLKKRLGWYLRFLNGRWIDFETLYWCLWLATGILNLTLLIFNCWLQFENFFRSTQKMELEYFLPFFRLQTFELPNMFVFHLFEFPLIFVFYSVPGLFNGIWLWPIDSVCHLARTLWPIQLGSPNNVGWEFTWTHEEWHYSASRWWRSRGKVWSTAPIGTIEFTLARNC